MGTNYYWFESDEKPHCATCECRDGLHIGKSSAGWCFSLHVYPELEINDLDDWQEKWKFGHIQDEYGKEISADKMLRLITERQGRGIEPRRWYVENSAMPGPNGLARHIICGICVGHGKGTWDLLAGEFF